MPSRYQGVSNAGAGGSREKGTLRRFIYILKRHRDTEDQKGTDLLGRIRKSISTEGKIF